MPFNTLIVSLTSVAIALVGLAFLTSLVSKNANTSGVIQAASSGLATDIQAATAPITGNTFGGGLTLMGAPIG